MAGASLVDLAGVAARRRAYVTLALRRARPGTGSSRDLLQRRTSSYRGMTLTELIRRTAYVVVGGVATRLYMPERATLDIAILVRARDAAALAAELEQGGALRRGALAIGGTTWELPDGTPLDVVESAALWVEAALAHPRRGPDGLPYVALPYLVVMKLQSGRAQDIADMSRMVGLATDEDLEAVRAAIARHVPDAIEDLEALITLGRLEMRGNAG